MKDRIPMPPAVDGRKHWLSLAQLAEILNCSPKDVDRALKDLGLHGEDDPEHKWSQPVATEGGMPVSGFRTFQSEIFGKLRVYIDETGKAWFCGRDIALAFGYSPTSKVSMIFAHVPKDRKDIKPIPTSGGHQEMLCLVEEGVYSFFTRCDVIRASYFRKWLAGEVINNLHQGERNDHSC